jgi:selenide,water dikinase
LKRNSGAKPGDKLILGKPLGVGILTAALKKEKLDAAGYAAMIASTTKLNTPGMKLGQLEGVNALTDVTGFGLAGHLLEICRGSNMGAIVEFSKLPMIANAPDLARQGFVTGASERNWDGYGCDVAIDPKYGKTERDLLTDPQTSGGLLVACDSDVVDSVLAIFKAEGFAEATVIGEMTTGRPQLKVD